MHEGAGRTEMDFWITPDMIPALFPVRLPEQLVNKFFLLTELIYNLLIASIIVLLCLISQDVYRGCLPENIAKQSFSSWTISLLFWLAQNSNFI